MDQLADHHDVGRLEDQGVERRPHPALARVLHGHEADGSSPAWTARTTSPTVGSGTGSQPSPAPASAACEFVPGGPR